MTATILEAETNLADLVQRAQAGESVIIVSATAKMPLVEIKAIPKRGKGQRLGVRETPGFEIGAGFWEPLPAGWSGEDEQ